MSKVHLKGGRSERQADRKPSLLVLSAPGTVLASFISLFSMFRLPTSTTKQLAVICSLSKPIHVSVGSANFTCCCFPTLAAVMDPESYLRTRSVRCVDHCLLWARPKGHWICHKGLKLAKKETLH